MSCHDRALKLLAQLLPAGPMDAVLECEARLGLRLPASVREWFGPLNGAELLGRYSNTDRAVLPRDFEVVKLGARPMIIVLHENQSVCWWAFEFDGSDDPPVHVNVNPPPDDLTQYAPTFSEFVYVRMFDFGWWPHADGSRNDEEPERSLIEVRDALRADSLAWLRANFTSDPGSLGWPPEAITHRFSSGPMRIVIYETDGEADWVLSGPSARAVEVLRRKLEGVW